MLLQKNKLLKIIVLACFFSLSTLAIEVSIFYENSNSCGGPHNVLASLLKGLQRANISYNTNPSMGNVAKKVIVLSGEKNLRDAINWKHAGIVRKLLAGPNILNSPKDRDFLLVHLLIDKCIVPCDWIRVAYEEDAPQLCGRIASWYAGVDEYYWKPDNSQRNLVVIYWKTESIDFCNQVKASIEKYGYNTEIIKYGSYNREQFKAALNKAIFAVFISRSESQGIALAETWSMDVPTLVWNPQELTYLGRKYSEVSAAPYLSSHTGKYWKSTSDLEEYLKSFNLSEFKPRKWVEENMTDLVSAELLMKIFKEIA